MENKLYSRFLGLFDSLNKAALIICQVLEEEDYKEEIQNILYQTNEYLNIPYENIQKEIEHNLFDSKDKEEVYIIRILKDWVYIFPYLDVSRANDYAKINGLPVIEYNYQHDAVKSLIERNFGIIEPRLHYYNATSIEKYILLCFGAYLRFFTLLNELCVDFKLDLVKIQATTVIHVWDRFDSDFKIWNNSKRYYIKNDLMKDIYSICESTFDCDYDTFLESIETGNFNLLKIKKYNIVKDLTYRLSSIMGNGWYTDICKTMGWEKSDCSGQGQKLSTNKTTRRLNKTLKRPEKE